MRVCCVLTLSHQMCPNPTTPSVHHPTPTPTPSPTPTLPAKKRKAGTQMTSTLLITGETRKNNACYGAKHVVSLEAKGSNCMMIWLVYNPFCLSPEDVYVMFPVKHSSGKSHLISEMWTVFAIIYSDITIGCL